MTSLLISAFKDRETTVGGLTQSADCAFCRIISGETPAFKIYEDENVFAILDIYPIRLGHTLVIPKMHHARLADLPPDLSAAMGLALQKVTNAVCQALDNPDCNVVCNQGYAQVVPHVHFHVVPAPTFSSADTVTTTPANAEAHSNPSSLWRELATRTELDDEVGQAVMSKIRSRL